MGPTNSCKNKLNSKINWFFNLEPNAQLICDVANLNTLNWFGVLEIKCMIDEIAYVVPCRAIHNNLIRITLKFMWLSIHPCHWQKKLSLHPLL